MAGNRGVWLLPGKPVGHRQFPGGSAVGKVGFLPIRQFSLSCSTRATRSFAAAARRPDPVPMNLDRLEVIRKTIPKNASGVYVIATKDREIVYVGESHSGTLRKTLSRHFQKWKGKTAGPTYSRRTHLVAIVRTRAENAKASQDNLIAELRPRDNTEAKPEWWEFWK